MRKGQSLPVALYSGYHCLMEVRGGGRNGRDTIDLQFTELQRYTEIREGFMSGRKSKEFCSLKKHQCFLFHTSHISH